MGRGMGPETLRKPNPGLCSRTQDLEASGGAVG